jgi:hypothetical protein
MRDTMTLKEAAAAFSVTSTISVRRILSLHTDEGMEKAHAGYDAAGRHLVRRHAVMDSVRERAGRGNWRAENLGVWAEPRTKKVGNAPDDFADDGVIEG